MNKQTKSSKKASNSESKIKHFWKRTSNLLRKPGNTTWLLVSFSFLVIGLLFLDIFVMTMKYTKGLNISNHDVWLGYDRIIVLYILALIFILPSILMMVIYVIKIVNSLRLTRNLSWKTHSKLSLVLITLPVVMMFIILAFTFAAVFFASQVFSDYGFTNPTLIVIYITINFDIFFIVTMVVTILPWISSKIFEKITKRIKQ